MDRTQTEPRGATLVGVCAGPAEAGRAVKELRAVGFREDQIGVVRRDGSGTAAAAERSGLPNDPTHTRWEEGSGIGAAVGAAGGLGLGLAVAAGLIPAVGPIIAGGALVALLASAGAGATAGTLVGALIGLGVPEADATHYQEELAAGRVLVTVRHADDRTAEALGILRRHGTPENPGSPVGVYGTGARATPY